MSNFLAVATVTATLERTLQAAVGADVPGASVTTVRPNGPNSGVPDTGVNLFLYQVTPNVALRNRDLPSRRPDGQLTQQPIAALDLHYLLSFYGAEADLEPQRLLGSAVRTLHAQPLLVRETIRNTVGAVGFLNGSNLADQVETVRFTPLPLNLEELSKLWSVFFQTTYVLSVAYQASVVLISAEEAPVLAQPVQERVVFAVPSVDLTVQALQPDLLDDLQLWLRADAAVAYDSQGRVTRWADQSGRGSNSFQIDDARKPRFIREGLNGKPVLRFDGVDDYLALEAPSYAAAGQIDGLTLFALVRSSTAAAQILVGFDGDEYWRAALRGAVGGPSWQTRPEVGGGDDLTSAGAITDGRWRLVSWRFAAGEVPDKQIFVDGDEAASIDAHGGAQLGSGVTRFGFIGVGSQADTVDGTLGAADFLAGDVAEIVLYSRGLTDLERRQIERYLVEKYATT